MNIAIFMVTVYSKFLSGLVKSNITIVQLFLIGIFVVEVAVNVFALVVTLCNDVRSTFVNETKISYITTILLVLLKWHSF